jgi:hypothetical protein
VSGEVAKVRAVQWTQSSGVLSGQSPDGRKCEVVRGGSDVRWIAI